MEENFLVIMETEEEERIKCFWTKNIAELLKFFQIAKDINIPIDIPCDTDSERTKYDGSEAYIESIRIQFGSSQSLTTLTIIVRVI